MLSSGPERIVIVAVVVMVEGSVATAHLVTRHAHATVAALDQPAQQPVIRFRTTRAPFGVVVADTLRCLEEFFADDCGNRYGDPLVTGTHDLALCLCWVAAKNGCGAVVVCTAYVSFVAYHAPDYRYSPNRLPARRWRPVLVELPTDLPHRKMVLDIVAKDAAHDRRLGFVDLEVCGSSDAARNASIPIGAFPRDHLTSTRAPQLTAAISLGDLRSLIFGDHALHLSEQLGLRIVGKGWGVMEQHRDAVARQLVDHNDLVGIHTGQAIRRQAPDGVKPCGFGGIPERIETGAV